MKEYRFEKTCCVDRANGERHEFQAGSLIGEGDVAAGSIPAMLHVRWIVEHTAPPAGAEPPPEPPPVTVFPASQDGDADELIRQRADDEAARQLLNWRDRRDQEQPDAGDPVDGEPGGDADLDGEDEADADDAPPDDDKPAKPKRGRRK